LVYAARLAHMVGRIDEERVAQHVQIVAAHDLPVSIPASADPDELLTVMRRDKKSTGDGLTFVLDGPRGVELVGDVPAATALAAMKQMRG
jgi:5-deoxy-5-amino-3-dehydroquinate synthase